MLESSSFSGHRIPVYVLVDCSRSLAGEAVHAINLGIKCFLEELRNEPQAANSVWVSLISIMSTAKVEVPLYPLMEFIPPVLSTGGKPNLGEAFRKLRVTIDHDQIESSLIQRGNYRPFVFLFLGNEPTDDWREPLRELYGNGRVRKIYNLIVIGCGSIVPTSVLTEISPVAMRMENMSSGDFSKFFCNYSS